MNSNPERLILTRANVGLVVGKQGVEYKSRNVANPVLLGIVNSGGAMRHGYIPDAANGDREVRRTGPGAFNVQFSVRQIAETRLKRKGLIPRGEKFQALHVSLW